MNIQSTADLALQIMLEQGFDDAQVSVDVCKNNMLSFHDDEVSVMRSNEKHQLNLNGIVDGRRASADIGDLNEESIRAAAKRLFASASAAPQDLAHAVSSNELATITRGPQKCDAALLALKVGELLDFRNSETPRTHLNEGSCSYTHNTRRVLTSRGSDLISNIGYYSLDAYAVAREGVHVSSANGASGNCEDIAAQHAADWFGIGLMLRETEAQLYPQGINEGFIGDVILTPAAADAVLDWLLAHLKDVHLIGKTSVYRNRVGEQIASPLFSVRSHFDGTGSCPVTADAFNALPITVVENGKLNTLLPSLYASRKTGVKHVPALAMGWSVDSGNTPLDDMVSGVRRGALVNYLSMGIPASNGDFSAVIKCSSLIDNGAIGPALTGVMMTGNIGKLLQDIMAISVERIDYGFAALPWIKAANMRFS